MQRIEIAAAVRFRRDAGECRHGLRVAPMPSGPRKGSLRKSLSPRERRSPPARRKQQDLDWMARRHRYRNPWPGQVEHGPAAVARWIFEGRKSAARQSPAPRLPTATPSFERPRAQPGTLTATWVGHATTLLQLGPLNVLTDPMWSERASPVQFAGPRRRTPPGVPLEQLPGSRWNGCPGRAGIRKRSSR